MGLLYHFHKKHETKNTAIRCVFDILLNFLESALENS